MAIGGFTSCTSEELIGPRADSGDVSIIFSVKDIQTKAETGTDAGTETGANEHYKYATTDEITINNCIIAAFNGDITASGADDLDCVRYEEVSTMASGGLVEVNIETSSKGKVPSYKYTLKDVKMGKTKTVSFLVIANSQNRSDAKVGKDSKYSDFKNLVETTTDFKAGELVKVGYKVVKDLSATNNVVKVPLIQLTARIDFGGVTLDKEFEATGGSEWTEVKVNDEKVSKDEAIKKNLLNSVGLDGKKGCWKEDYYYWSEGKWNPTDYRVIFHRRDSVTETTTTTGYNLVVGEKKEIGGVNTQSTLAIFDTTSVENQMYGKKDFPMTGNTFTFYTYENNKGNDVTLTVNCGIGGSGTTTTVTTTTYVKYSYEIQEEVWEDDWNRVGGGEIGSYKPVGAPEVSESQGGSVEDSRDYMITLDGSKIIKGHLYKVTGVCTPSRDAVPVLKWTVINLEPEEDILIEFN